MLTWEECHCLLIRAGGRPAGFALVSLQPFPHMPRDVDARLAEFFVAQPYRRRGSDARPRSHAGALPGVLGARVVTGRDAALAFWRAVTGEATGGGATTPRRSGPATRSRVSRFEARR